jgi:hypothetical protein
MGRRGTSPEKMRSRMDSIKEKEQRFLYIDLRSGDFEKEL